VTNLTIAGGGVHHNRTTSTSSLRRTDGADLHQDRVVVVSNCLVS
jgi:hypothetical protein